MKQLLCLLDLEDFEAARREIIAFRQTAAVTPSIRSLLDGILSFIDRDRAAARAALTASIDGDPRNNFAHYWLARMEAIEGRVPQAVARIQQALEIDPQMSESWFLYGSLALEGKDYNVAMHSLFEAIRHDIDNPKYWHQLNQWLPRLQVSGTLPEVRSLLSEALRRQKLEIQDIEQVIYAVLRASVEFQQLTSMAGTDRLDAQLQSGQAFALLEDEFLLLVLRRTTLRIVEYERALTELRRALLRTIGRDMVLPSLRQAAVRITSALATYVLTTEFIFHATDTESRDLDTCRQRLRDAPRDEVPLLIAIIACYTPIADDPQLTAVRELDSPATRLPEFREMIHLNIVEPKLLSRHQASISSFGNISNTVSLAVRQQYEEHPYPRWRLLGEPRSAPFDNRISRTFPQLRPEQRPKLQATANDPLNVLIAGCGTGRQALWCAREYPNSHLLAVDLSRASLAYASMKAEELNIANIEFRQGDLLDIAVLGRQFDLIESIGVLHHMEDPESGLLALSRCLRPGGWMRIALYSHLARQAIRTARQRIAASGFPSTADGIRGFRHALMSDPSDPLLAACARWRDFFSLSECRDMLFHVHEHQFTTQGLEALIARADLEFMGFEADVSFAAGARPGVSDWQDLRQWGAFEEAHPDFFGSMYMMWLRKPA